MMTADLGACEWLVWDLRRSNLVDRGKLEQIIGEFLQRVPKAEPPQLADYLVENQVLTRFQADSLLNNKGSGLVMGPFIVMDILGTGSMGTVYKAQSKVNNEWYAVKVLPRRSMWNIRVAKRKVRDFEQVKHPAVVPFVDVGTSGSTHYLAWPFVEGDVLTKVVEAHGKLPVGEAARIAMQIAEGLDACHQRGILHALLKPANLLLTPDQQIKILDFGVGSLLGETESESVVDTMSTANTMASSLECASPESIMDPTSVSPASDQYSLGCCLYYCLTGQYPFPGNNAVEKMMLHQTKEPTPIRDLVPEVPAELSAVVERLMRKSPADRYPSMGEVVLSLRPFAAAPASPMAQPRQQVRPAPSKQPATRGPNSVDQAPPPWPTPAGNGTTDEADMPPMPQAPAYDAPAGRPAAQMPGRGNMGQAPVPPSGFGQPPMPQWGAQGGFPSEPAASPEPSFPQPGMPPMPPMPQLPGRGDLFEQQQPGHAMYGGEEPRSNKLLIIGFVVMGLISLGLGGALVWMMMHQK